RVARISCDRAHSPGFHPWESPPSGIHKVKAEALRAQPGSPKASLLLPPLNPALEASLVLNRHARTKDDAGDNCRRREMYSETPSLRQSHHPPLFFVLPCGVLVLNTARKVEVGPSFSAVLKPSGRVIGVTFF